MLPQLATHDLQVMISIKQCWDYLWHYELFMGFCCFITSIMWAVLMKFGIVWHRSWCLALRQLVFTCITYTLPNTPSIFSFKAFFKNFSVHGTRFITFCSITCSHIEKIGRVCGAVPKLSTEPWHHSEVTCKHPYSSHACLWYIAFYPYSGLLWSDNWLVANLLCNHNLS